MELHELESIIDRYLAGQATEEEKDFIARWMDRPEAASGVDLREQDAIRKRLWGSIDGATAPVRPVLVRTLLVRILPYAAAAVLVLAGVLFWFYRPASKRATGEAIYVTAMPGQQRTYGLPDSSTVHLFPHSTLMIPVDYNVENRTVTITGRGFFEVRSNPGKPFSVVTGELNTTVLGTSFEVSGKVGLPAAVTVCTGRVAVAGAQGQVVQLVKNERLRYNPTRRLWKVDTVDASALCEWWKTGIAFQQTPLQEVVRTLSDWYNVQINITDRKWLEETVTIRFNGQPLDSAMMLLSGTLGFGYRRQASGIVIY